jgi:hypothetical protein
MSSSVNASNQAKFSGVAQALASASASSLDTCLIFSDFFVIGFPETYDAANGPAPCVYRNTYTVGKSGNWAGGDKARFAIIDPPIFLFDKRAIEKKDSGF